VPQIAFYSGELMEPIGIRAAFPAAMFIARGWVAPDSSISDHFASVAGDQIWGIAVGLGEEVEGDLVSVTLDDGRSLEAVLAEGLLAGDPAQVLANARYWESPPEFVTRLHAVVNPGVPED
jgi:hypothetical protein